jgi:hypothetical protein
MAVAPALRQELDALWTAIGNHVHTVAGVQPGSGSVVSAPSGTTPVTRDIASRRIVTDDTVVAGVGVTG